MVPPRICGNLPVQNLEEGRATEILCNNKKSIIYLANQGTVVFHVWQSKKETLDRPDKIILDLDPSGAAGFAKLIKAAHLVEGYFKDKKLDTFPVLTGKKGIHICHEMSPDRDFDTMRMELREMCESLVDGHPTLFTIEMQKNKRDGKIFLDYVRNAYGQTTICPYSLRPTPLPIGSLRGWFRSIKSLALKIPFFKSRFKLNYGYLTYILFMLS